MRRFVAVVSLLLSPFVAAQEYEVRSEFHWCTLNEGKTMKDAIADSKRYGEFSASEGTKYMQLLLTPMHAGDSSDYDYIIWGSWPDGEAMYEEWGSFANNYGGWSGNEDSGTPAGTRHRSIAMFNAGVVHNRIPQDERDQRQPVQFAQCSMRDGVTVDQLYAQAEKDKALMDKGGFKGWGIHYFFPYMGFDGTQDYDFVQMNHWYSFEARGHMANNWLEFVENNPEVEGGMDLLVDCKASRSFVAELMFDNN
jgi:hypothetical protein